MARIVIEDAVLLIMAFYVISSVIFSVPGLLDTYTPGQRYNMTTNSFEPYTRTLTSIYTNNQEINDTLAQYNSSATSSIDANAMLNPLAVVSLVQKYAGLLSGMISYTMLAYVLTPFIGPRFAQIITFILNIMVIIVLIRVITGRIRWD